MELPNILSNFFKPKQGKYNYKPKLLIIPKTRNGRK